MTGWILRPEMFQTQEALSLRRLWSQSLGSLPGYREPIPCVPPVSCLFVLALLRFDGVFFCFFFF